MINRAVTNRALAYVARVPNLIGGTIPSIGIESLTGQWRPDGTIERERERDRGRKSVRTTKKIGRMGYGPMPTLALWRQ